MGSLNMGSRCKMKQVITVCVCLRERGIERERESVECLMCLVAEKWEVGFCGRWWEPSCFYANKSKRKGEGEIEEAAESWIRSLDVCVLNCTAHSNPVWPQLMLDWYALKDRQICTACWSSGFFPASIYNHYLTGSPSQWISLTNHLFPILIMFPMK